jgi:hypothetical protein
MYQEHLIEYQFTEQKLSAPTTDNTIPLSAPAEI